VKLTIYLHLVLSSEMVELYRHSPIRLHGVVLNESSTGMALPLSIFNTHSGHKPKVWENGDADEEIVLICCALVTETELRLFHGAYVLPFWILLHRNGNYGLTLGKQSVG
jgi:hypothetical protein